MPSLFDFGDEELPKKGPKTGNIENTETEQPDESASQDSNAATNEQTKPSELAQEEETNNTINLETPMEEDPVEQNEENNSANTQSQEKTDNPETPIVIENQVTENLNMEDKEQQEGKNFHEEKEEIAPMNVVNQEEHIVEDEKEETNLNENRPSLDLPKDEKMDESESFEIETKIATKNSAFSLELPGSTPDDHLEESSNMDISISLPEMKKVDALKKSVEIKDDVAETQPNVAEKESNSSSVEEKKTTGFSLELPETSEQDEEQDLEPIKETPTLNLELTKGQVEEEGNLSDSVMTDSIEYGQSDSIAEDAQEGNLEDFSDGTLEKNESKEETITQNPITAEIENTPTTMEHGGAQEEMDSSKSKSDSIEENPSASIAEDINATPEADDLKPEEAKDVEIVEKEEKETVATTSELETEEILEKEADDEDNDELFDENNSEPTVPELPEWDLTKTYYPIGEVAELFNINVSNIRFWTNEFKIRTRTTRKGDRLYTKKQIKTLRTIYHLVKEQKFTLEGAKQMLKSNKKRIEKKLDLKEELTQLYDQLSAIRSGLD